MMCLRRGPLLIKSPHTSYTTSTPLLLLSSLSNIVPHHHNTKEIKEKEDPKQHRRTFFASSTDHTSLLQTAEVHCLLQQQPSSSSSSSSEIKKYVLAAKGMDLSMVQKVPQLHLGRIYYNPETHIMYGAKVINRTLGKAVDVCDRLVDAVIYDFTKQQKKNNNEEEDKLRAMSTLHGMTDWILTHNNNNGIDSLMLSQEELEQFKIFIQTNNKNNNKDSIIIEDDKQKILWDALAREYISKSLSEEAMLYQSKGGTLESIQHGMDTSEFADTSLGAMATFTFSQ